MKRRDLLKLPLFPVLDRLFVATSPLKITKVEAFVVRSPNRKETPEDMMQMPPVGSMTGGVGLWNRLDFSSPSRSKNITQAVLVKISTNQGVYGWGECHAPAASQCSPMRTECCGRRMSAPAPRPTSARRFTWPLQRPTV